MSEQFIADTSMKLLEVDRVPIAGVARSIAMAFLLRLAAAGTHGVQHVFWEENLATQTVSGALAESSTQFTSLSPEMKAKLQAVWDGARREIIEDGMSNSVTENLPELIARDFSSVIPALVSAIEMQRTTPIIAAEVLKTLGRLQNPASHALRRWALERALTLTSPFIRDGAGLGLARLADPGAVPYLRRAAESDPQTREDLQLVIDELSEAMTNGVPAPGCD